MLNTFQLLVLRKLALTRKSIIVTIALLTVLSSCTKSEDDGVCSGIPDAKITAPASVEAGEEITLNALALTGARYYEWSGPNNFQSTDQSPTLSRVQSNAAGKYTVAIGFDGGCIRTATTDSIIVTVPAASCAPGQNTGAIAGAGSMSFTTIRGAASGGSFFITANGSQGDLEFEFPGTSRPVAGVYLIQPLTGQWLAGNVRVRFVAQSSNWPAGSGKVYVKIINNRVTATVCNVPVFNQTFLFSSTASASITEQ